VEENPRRDTPQAPLEIPHPGCRGLALRVTIHAQGHPTAFGWLRLFCLGASWPPNVKATLPKGMAESEGPCSRSAPARTNPALFPAFDSHPPLIAAWPAGLHAQPQSQGEKAMKQDVYVRITNKIVAEFEKGAFGLG
jgi:hypothetical protein